MSGEKRTRVCLLGCYECDNNGSVKAILRSTPITVALLLSTGAGMASNQSAPLQDIEAKPGEGVLCLWALTSVASEVGKRCPGKGDPNFQATLEESVALIDRYVAANGKMSAENIDRFKREQGGVGQNAAKLCTPDGLQLYDAMRSQGAAALRTGVSKAVARPGTPAWGDCV